MTYRTSFDLSVYFVADPSVCGGRRIEDVVEAAVRGGVTMVQLRNKIDSADIILEQARSIQGILADSNISFLMNDHVEIAAKINAGGVHIGQGDIDAGQARSIIGEGKILGLTAYTRTHYALIDPDVIDYVGTGPFYSTLTKPDKAVLGADGFKVLSESVSVPVVGIGGITPDNAVDVICAGAAGVAMMRSVSEADDPSVAVSNFVSAVAQARQ